MTQTKSLCTVGVLGVCGLVLLVSCNRTGSQSSASAKLAINEVMANAVFLGVDPRAAEYQAVLTDENGPLVDPDGAAVDWVEIFNSNPFPVNLAGHTLSDNRQKPRKYRFPNGLVLAPGAFVVVICDNQPEKGAMHAAFRLDPAGETVFIFGANGAVLLSQVTYKNAPENVAVGRSPDGFRPPSGFGGYDRIHAPTPNAPNHPTGVMLPHKDLHEEEISVEAINGGETFRVTARVVVDDHALVDLATVEAVGSLNCNDTIPETVEALQVQMVQVGDPTDVLETRKDFNDEDAEVVVVARLYTFMAEFPSAEVPEFTAEGVLQVRVVFETALGAAVGFRCTGERPTLVISEYAPRNQFRLLVDRVNAVGFVEENAAPDWFEIYNYGEESVDLTRFRVVGPGGLRAFRNGTVAKECECNAFQDERRDCLYTWRFVCEDAGVDIQSIAPGESIFLLADQDRPPFREYYPAGEEPSADNDNRIFSVQFRLARDQPDSFGLIDNRGQVVDFVEFDFSRDLGNPAISEPCTDVDCDAEFQTVADVSFGRFPNGEMPETPMTTGNLKSDASEVPEEHTFFLCATPGDENTRDIALCATDPVDPEFAPRLLMRPASIRGGLVIVGYGRECPRPNESPLLTTILTLDNDTVESPGGVPDPDVVEEKRFDVQLVYQVDDAPPETIDLSELAQPLGLIEMSDCDRECLGVAGVPGRARQFRVHARIPAQSAGTRVQYEFRARDFVQKKEVFLRKGEPETEGLVFSYVVSEDVVALDAPVAFNEILFDNDKDGFLLDLYPQEVRDMEEFRPPDYVELVNTSDTEVDLSGFFLTHADQRVCVSLPCAEFDDIENVRAFKFPGGTTVAPQDVILVLFVFDRDHNTAPDLSGQPFESKTVLARDAFEINDCRQSLFLISPDDTGNCQVSRLDFGPGPTAQCVLMPNVALGRIPDGVGDLAVLAKPTPGVRSCGRAPELDRDIIVDPPSGCVGPTDTIQLSWSVTIDRLEFESNPDRFGLESIEVILSFDGVPDPPRPIAEFDSLIAEPVGQDPPESCRRLLEMLIQIPGPTRGAERFDVAVRITDTAGRVLNVMPPGFEICESSERPFIRGDANGDGRINLTDVISLVRVLNDAEPVPACADALDVDDNGTIDTADRDLLSDFVGGSVATLAPPFPDPGVDPSDDDLVCR